MLKSLQLLTHQNLILLSQIALFITLSLSGLCATAIADDIDDQRSSLQQVKKQISTTTGELKKKKAAEQSALQQLESLDQKISRNDAALKSATTSVTASRKNIRELKDKITSYRVIIGRSQKDVEKRLRALYTSGNISSLRLIFSTETPLELSENMNFLSRISAHDKELLGSYRQRMVKLNQARHDLEQQISQKQDILHQQQEQKKQLFQNRKQRKNLIHRIRRDSATLSSLLKELEERSVRMTTLIKALEKKQSAAYLPTNNSRSFSSAKGHIPWSSSGAVRENFGTHKNTSFGSQHKSNGIVIAAVPGTRIKAIWPGRIAFSSPFKGYGNLIIIDHGHQYYSLYAQAAHLNLPVGTNVNAGEVITTSGFEGRDSYYLEIRRGTTPLDPSNWLKPRTR
ncbi:MAG: peptidoglycan DD-metalloendopeptidase family protein [Thermodesulfobacteriota bacterium]|nr:peptidoglycan DD-metalloendopeptidase family protein [Thermodesulfobacteriota bacterium]